MNQFLGRYQILYGVLGSAFHTYYLCTAVKTLQLLLVAVGMLGFCVWVLLAGVAQFRQWPVWPWLVLPGQLLQVVDMQFGELFLRFRCGFSLNVQHPEAVLKWTMNLTDTGTQVVWRMPGPATEGVNLIPILICVLVFVTLSDKKHKDTPRVI